MKLVCAMVARYAELQKEGSINIQCGDVDSVLIRGTFPAAMPLPIYYAVKLSVPPEASGRPHTAEVELLAPGGEVLARGGDTLVSPPSRGGRNTSLGFVLTLAGLQFPAPGEYTFRLSADGEELTRTPLYVDQAVPNTPEG